MRPNEGVFHVIGAGLAGLSAALCAAKAGFPVRLYEAAPQAGGRCRSFIDANLGCTVDIGTHLLLDNNQHTLNFLNETGGNAHIRIGQAAYPFVDMKSGKGWIVSSRRRPHGLWEGIKARGWLWHDRQATVAERLSQTPSYERLWRPLCLAMLNTDPRAASAHAFAQILRAIPLHNHRLPRPVFFPAGLSAAFIDPALKTLKRHAVKCLFCHRLTGFDANHLSFSHTNVPLGKNDWVILALPPEQIQSLLPTLPRLPFNGILNVHFRLPWLPTSIAKTEMLGLVNALPQWLFINGNVLSVTISDAESLFGQPQELVAARIWRDLARVVGTEASRLPPYLLLKNRQATLRHSPDTMAARPDNRIPELPHWRLAGDWLASPWPCSMEAAITSGLAAANSLIFGRDSIT